MKCMGQRLRDFGEDARDYWATRHERGPAWLDSPWLHYPPIVMGLIVLVLIVLSAAITSP